MSVIICVRLVECSHWNMTVVSKDCVTELLVENDWADVVNLTKEDRKIALSNTINKILDGKVHSFVDLSAR